MSVTKFFTWIIAGALTGAFSLAVVRYGFDESSWGTDAVWAGFFTMIFTRNTHEGLLSMWIKDTKEIEDGD